MKARLWLIATLALASMPLVAQEACEQDDAGLANQLDKNIVFNNARTAEDFLNESLHHFFTHGFHGWRDFTMLTSDLTVAEWASFFFNLASRFEYSYVACNDIGQCAQGEVISHFSRMPNAAATEATNSVLDWITGGELSIGRIFSPGLVRHDFTVETGDGDEHSDQVYEYTPRYIANNPEEYPVRADDDPLVADKRCRNNFGELEEGQEEIPTNSGGFELPTEPDSPGFWIKVHSGWHCYADETGVVCRKIYSYEWVDW